jgi:tRNA/rRNA methyltransferase
MQRNLRNMFHRMELTQQDVRTWWGMVVRLVEGPRVKVQTRKRVKRKSTSRAEPSESPGPEE